MPLPKPLPPSRRPIVGGNNWHDIVAELIGTEERERDSLLIMQAEIAGLRDRTDNPRTLKMLADLSDEMSRLIASKIRRMGLLHELRLMRERETAQGE